MKRSTDTKKKMSIAIKKAWKTKAYRQSHTKCWKDPDHKKYRGRLMKKLWKSEKYRNKVIKGVSKPKSVLSTIKYSIEMKKRWSQSDYIKKIMKSHHLTPNKSEKFLRKILNTNFPNTYKFVGDGKVVIGKRCPDFIDQKNNRIIELYGRYWHSKDNPDDKINYYKSFGYSCCVIWDDELKNVDQIVDKVTNFHNVLRESPILAVMREQVVNIG